MAKSVTIFGSSTAYYAHDPGCSYVDMLKNDYDVKSLCMNGYTIWHANYILPQFLTERGPDKWIILHVGASECATMKISNFLVLASYWLIYGSNDHYFQTFIGPKMYRASLDLADGIENYYSLLNRSEFLALYDKLLQGLESFSVLCVGMSKPNEATDIRMEQAITFETAIDECCRCRPWTRQIRVWDLCDGQIIDSNHLTNEGHKILYNEIRGVIN